MRGSWANDNSVERPSPKPEQQRQPRSTQKILTEDTNNRVVKCPRVLIAVDDDQDELNRVGPPKTQPQDLAQSFNRIDGQPSKPNERNTGVLRKVQERISTFCQPRDSALTQVEEARAAPGTQAQRFHLTPTGAANQEQVVFRESEKEHEIKLLKAQLVGTNQELQKVHSMFTVSQQQLQACKDDLFRLQPIAQTPDSDIARGFNDLCHQIVGFIDEEVLAFSAAQPNADPSQIFSAGKIASVQLFLNKYPNAGEYIVRYFIHGFLQEKIFSDDPTRIALWRSETLKPIVATKMYADAREQHLRHLLALLFELTSTYLPILQILPDSHSRLYDQVLVPAADLAIKIKVSASKYEFRHPGDGLWSRHSALLSDFGIVTMIDIMTWRPLKEDDDVEADKNNYFGDVILAVEPSLRRLHPDGTRKLLRRPMWLVHPDKPIKKQSRGGRPNLGRI